MASVYLAQMGGTPGIRKWVAVKLIHPRMEHDARFVKMFLHEAQILARLGHPNVCTLLDYGEQAGSPYIAMEYLHGESLASVVRRLRSRDEKMPLVIAARIVADAARGLHAAHELKSTSGEPAGVVHRDVSPQNVFVLYSGITKVVDFGIARSDEREDTTRTGELKGKFQYMAPEQINQAPLDRRADVFALGITLWELCAPGIKLFRRDRDLDTMLAVLNEPIAPITEHRADCPPALAEVIARALERDRDKRHQTADDFARALGAYVTQAGGAESESVADFMRTLFDDRIVAREKLLSDVALDPSHIPVVEVESGSNILTHAARRREETPGAKPRIVGSERPTTAPPRARARARARANVGVVIAVGIVLAALVGVALSTQRAPESTEARPVAMDPAVVEVVPTPPAPVPVVVEPEVVAPTEVVTPTVDTAPVEPRVRSRAARPSAPRETTPVPPIAVAPPPAAPVRAGPRIMTDFEEIE